MPEEGMLMLTVGPMGANNLDKWWRKMGMDQSSQEEGESKNGVELELEKMELTSGWNIGVLGEEGEEGFRTGLCQKPVLKGLTAGPRSCCKNEKTFSTGL